MKNYNKNDISDFTYENFIDPRELLDLYYSLQADLDAMSEDDLPADDEDLIELEESVNDLKSLLEDINLDESLIRDSYIDDYLRELVFDIGDLPINLPAYIENNIDWDGVCDDLKADYSSYEIDGITYWQRAC